MTDLTCMNDLRALLLSGEQDWAQYGNVRTVRRGDLILFNYTSEAQFANRWNWFEQVSRGLIMNGATGECVARPFDKFFNWNEGGRATTAEMVEVTEKIDGSLGILYRDGDELSIATRGSFGSEQAQWATDWLRRFRHYTDIRDNLPDEYTMLFEIVYPENRIVVDYRSTACLVLIGLRDRFQGNDYYYDGIRDCAKSYGLTFVDSWQANSVRDVLDTLASLDPARQEGWVARFADGQRFKFKGEQYLELHKLLSGLSWKHVLEAIQAGTDPRQAFAKAPDEWYGQVCAWQADIEVRVLETEGRVRAIVEAAPKTTRKDFAQYVLAGHKDDAAYCFACLDGKDMRPMILKRLEPPTEEMDRERRG